MNILEVSRKKVSVFFTYLHKFMTYRFARLMWKSKQYNPNFLVDGHMSEIH